MKPPYLHYRVTVQSPYNTHSSSLVTLARPPTSSLWITNRSSICFTMSLEQASFFTVSTSFHLRLFSFSFYFHHFHCFCSISSFIIHIIFLFFTPSLKCIFFSNHSHLRLFSLSSGLTPRLLVCFWYFWAFLFLFLSFLSYGTVW